MASEDDKGRQEVEKEDNAGDIDELIDEKQRLDSLFKEKFRKVITVMFTDLKGSTTITEMEGDFATRVMLKQHNDALIPIINENNGVLVKTMGDGTMSYFENAQDAIRAAASFQKAMDQMNMEKRFKVPIFVRIGINTGEGIVEKNDIYGDVVNVASRFESTAHPGEIYISESTYNAMSDKSEIYCRYVTKTTLKGKKEPFKVYKAFWNEKEVEKDIADAEKSLGPEERKAHKPLPFLVKLLIILLIPFMVVFILMKVGEMISKTSSTEDKRSVQHSVTIPEKSDEKKE